MDVNFTYVGNGNLIVIHSIDSDIYEDLTTDDVVTTEDAKDLSELVTTVNQLLLDKYYVAALKEFKHDTYGFKQKIENVHILSNGDFLNFSTLVAKIFFIGDMKQLIGSALANYMDEFYYSGCKLHVYVNTKNPKLNNIDNLKEQFPMIEIHDTDHVMIRGDEIARTYRLDERSNIESIMTQKITKLGG